MSSDQTSRDVKVLRELAKQYAETANLPVYAEKRRLWTELNSLQPCRPLVRSTFGMWNVWCREVFSDAAMQCQDPFYRQYERWFRMQLLQHETGDDTVLEPWFMQRASVHGGWDDAWGVHMGNKPSGVEGGAWKYDPPLKTWDDVAKLKAPVHFIDEADTARQLARVREAFGDLLPVHVDRGPACQGFMADISTHLCKLRGLEQVMVDMYESPRELHALLAFMRDGILANQAAAEAAGDYSLADHCSQEPTYCRELAPPRPDSGPCQRRELWGFAASQEFTLISPAMHDEFMLQYQLPILKNFGRTHYGCCEDLTCKIDMLRQVPNLRIIAVTPTANVHRCAAQIGTDYVMSWRPNPTDMVCYGYDEAKITRIVQDAMRSFRGLRLCIHLKDIETVEGDPSRLRRWVSLIRRLTE